MMHSMTLYGPAGVAAVSLAVLLAACWDLLYRRIPNRLTAALLGLWITVSIWTAAVGGQAAFPPPGMAQGAGCAAAVLAAGFLLFCMGAVGAGDVKMAAVLCLWLGDGSVAFLLATSLAGGLLIMQLPLLRQMETRLAVIAARIPAVPSGRRQVPNILLGKNPQGIPYGPAIAMGTFFTMLRAWF